jgi:hypothetical protein
MASTRLTRALNLLIEDCGTSTLDLPATDLAVDACRIIAAADLPEVHRVALARDLQKVLVWPADRVQRDFLRDAAKKALRALGA